jgi:hypothetical protein
VLIQIKLQLFADFCRIDVCRNSGITFAKHCEHRFVNIVINERD